MTMNHGLPFFNQSLVTLNGFFGGVLYAGIKRVTWYHQTLSGCGEDHEMKFKWVIFSAFVTFCLLMGTVLLWMVTMALMFYRAEKWWAEGRKGDPYVLKPNKYLKWAGVIVKILNVGSYLGLMFVGYFFTQYVRAGASCGGGN